MRVREHEFRLGVPRHSERRWPEGFLGMTHLAAILVRRRSEFVAMRIGVASHACHLAGFICGIFARGLMTFFALELEVFSFELERALLMHFTRI